MGQEMLRDKIALVTGGSGGIGRVMVRRLAAVGCHVAVGYASNADAANQAVSDATELGVRAIALQADLSDPDAVTSLACRASAELGAVDVLVPNAGISVPTDLAGVDLELWQRALAVNLTAPFLLAQHLVPGMAERGFGRVLFTSSVAAFTGGVVGPHYAASKAGLHGLVHWLASTYAAAGVTVNAVAPALVGGTEMMPADEQDIGRVPVGRFATTEEIADLAITMLSNGYLTSKIYLLDGGLYPHCAAPLRVKPALGDDLGLRAYTVMRQKAVTRQDLTCVESTPAVSHGCIAASGTFLASAFLIGVCAGQVPFWWLLGVLPKSVIGWGHVRVVTKTVIGSAWPW